MKKKFIINVIVSLFFIGCGTSEKKISPQGTSSLETNYSEAIAEINTYDTILILYQVTTESCIQNSKLDQELENDSSIIAYTMYLTDDTLECSDFERINKQTCREGTLKDESGDMTCIVVANFK